MVKEFPFDRNVDCVYLNGFNIYNGYCHKVINSDHNFYDSNSHTINIEYDLLPSLCLCYIDLEVFNFFFFRFLATVKFVQRYLVFLKSYA